MPAENWSRNFSGGAGIRLNPDLAEAHYNLGNASKANGQFEEAAAAYRQAIRLKPDYPEPQNNLGVVLIRGGRPDDAIAAFRQAIAINPHYADAYRNLGNAFKDIGRLEEAIIYYRKAIGIAPEHADAYDNLIFALQYQPGGDATAIYEELRRWNHTHAEPLKKFIQPHANNRDPDRRLRIGYVSADFREHVVGQNLLPLLREHDHGQMEIFCYSNMVRCDATTEQFRRYADGWRSIAGLSDSKAADLIRRTGSTFSWIWRCTRQEIVLRVFAHKPAPVQVTYLGYCSSTGLETMDYRLSDPYLDPPDSDLSLYSEKTIRLPETYWCYQPPRPDARAIAAAG